MTTALMNHEWLRKGDAAKYCGVSVRTMSDWQRLRLVRFSKPSRRVCLFRRSDLDRALDRMAIKAVGE
jgi:hypothetical protein